MPTKSSTSELYAIFLGSDWWIGLSRAKRRMVKRCEKCEATRNLQSHHIRYPDNWFDTRMDDLMVLCRLCHEKEHGIVRQSKFTPNTKQQASQWKQGNKARSFNHGKRRNFKKSRRSLAKERSRRERLQGLGRVEWKPWQKFRTKPIHNYINRGTSSN